jgi:hypothetical protein
MDYFTEFQQNDALRRFLIELKQYQAESLKHFHASESNGFFHFHDGNDPDKKLSKASTAISVASLIATGEWENRKNCWYDRTAHLAGELLRVSWDSAGLGANNVFTVGFVLEAVTVLLDRLPPEELNAFLDQPRISAKITEAEGILQSNLAEGYARVLTYPPSAYLTQLATRILKKRQVLTENVEAKVRAWAWRELSNQLSLIVAKSKAADLSELTYALIIVVSLGTVDERNPESNLLIRAGLDQFFEHQLDDGTWPRARPRFPDQKWGGSAFSFEYELLIQLLNVDGLRDKLLKYLPRLGKSAKALTDSRFELPNGGYGWTSGNYLLRPVPESWATAAVYHFAHSLERLVAEAIRVSAFEYLSSPYTEPSKGSPEFAPNFLDCPLRLKDKEESLKSVLFEHFAEPIKKNESQVVLGRGIGSGIPISAIFYGPPGTSKTRLAAEIAKYLGWPLLSIDPSHFVRRGLDGVQAEADRIFTILAALERVLVLLDEFDEMVRDRHSTTEVLSRFLTTAMLPKLTKINESRRIVFIVATNYISGFDLAIRRPGRFDVILQVMPPSCEAKLASLEEENLRKILQQITRDAHRKQQLAALTFDEFNAFKKQMVGDLEISTATELLEHTYQSCTLNSPYDDDDEKQTTWEAVCASQASKIRLPS